MTSLEDLYLAFRRVDQRSDDIFCPLSRSLKKITVGWYIGMSSIRPSDLYDWLEWCQEPPSPPPPPPHEQTSRPLPLLEKLVYNFEEVDDHARERRGCSFEWWADELAMLGRYCHFQKPKPIELITNFQAARQAAESQGHHEL